MQTLQLTRGCREIIFERPRLECNKSKCKGEGNIAPESQINKGKTTLIELGYLVGNKLSRDN